MNNILETNNLTKKIKKNEILHGVSIHVAENSVYGLLGPNGAGKSTLLKILTGAWNKTSGEILFEGKLWNKNVLKRIGAMIEGPAIYPNLTAYENLKILTILLDIRESRIDEVLTIVKLQQAKNKLVKNFSLGMKQRLGIGMAMINSPKLLILDEPTNGLDPIGIQELRDYIISLSREGKTVIVSSHILTEVQQISDKIGIIVNGYLKYESENQKGTNNLENIFMQTIKEEKLKNDYS
ncbi:lantibiotic protection ABC transporter ATP-binding subunit [Bombilactobacillus bombi]|uniref:lantibiotic protection ABC transporter ATP-binding subunit n=1 Tax=Bombilactobacillus bombi TaxID=1303590 RepID=UPI0015E5C5E3|nr:lantibiotic protection ABC transporter ATP-binding subunit [Bombilactobacillus bombi]MBA1434766.1 lantibiotic protection ABC transporter ATP-binding subunit [Bombilactobacillus bombi]